MEAYLTFYGNAAQALAFYAECLGGTISYRMTFGQSPMAAETPKEHHDMIMHALLEARGHKLMASDCPPGFGKNEGHKGFSLSVQSSDPVEAEGIFKALADGGKVVMPFGQTFWARGFGMLEDRFGVPWMVNCE